jgi:hypothetical protein
MPRTTATTVAAIIPVLVVFGLEVSVSEVCDDEAVEPVVGLEVLTAVLELLAAEVGLPADVLALLVAVLEASRAGIEAVPVAAARVTEVLAPGSAKIVPRVGVKVDAEQQLPS